jgi:hypothetical protein
MCVYTLSSDTPKKNTFPVIVFPDHEELICITVKGDGRVYLVFFNRAYEKLTAVCRGGSGEE